MSNALALGFKIAGALQNKFKDKLVVVRRCQLHNGREVLEYVLADGSHEGATAYSEAFFEDTDKQHINWLATNIFRELSQRLAWARMSIKNPTTIIKEKKRANTSTNAGSTHETERPREPKVSNPSERKAGRSTGTKARFDAVPQDAIDS